MLVGGGQFPDLHNWAPRRVACMEAWGMGGQSRVEASTQASEQMRMVFLDVELFDQPGVDGFHELSERI